MPVYRVMRESFSNDQGSYLPGVAWLYDGRQIYLSALPSYDAERQAIQERLDGALADGWHTDDIWAYWAEQGGQHQMSIRTRPEVLVAPNLKKALDAAVASLR